jgi:hypothetical protein
MISARELTRAERKAYKEGARRSEPIFDKAIM